MWAAHNEHEKVLVVKELLEQDDVSPNKPDNSGRTTTRLGYYVWAQEDSRNNYSDGATSSPTNLMTVA